LQVTLSYLCDPNALNDPDVFASAASRETRSKESVRSLARKFDEGKEVDLQSLKPAFLDVLALVIEFISRLPEPLFPRFYEAQFAIEIMGQRCGAIKKVEDLLKKEEDDCQKRAADDKEKESKKEQKQKDILNDLLRLDNDKEVSSSSLSLSSLDTDSSSGEESNGEKKSGKRKEKKRKKG